MVRLHKIIATALGSGYAPIAPGTAGSIVGIILLYAINYCFYRLGGTAYMIVWLDLLAIILMLFVGVKSIKEVHKFWEHDAGKIVIDEVVGVWIAVFAMPFQWQYYLYALILFRFFDIAKPLFIRRVDKMGGDWSVMLDDVLAGVYSLIVMQLLYYLNII